MSVYFAKVGRYIKVGYSENPERRVRRLFSSETGRNAPADAPRRARDRSLIATIPGTRGTEAACHRALADFAVGCEFFVDEPLVRDFIVNAQAGHIAPVARAGGPVVPDYDERDLAPREAELLRGALNLIFRRAS